MNDMKFTKYVVTALAGMMAASMIAGCGGQDKAAAEKKEPLRVATNATFVPFEFKDDANPEDYKGFEMDLIKAVGKELGREVQINNLPFSGIIPVIQQGDMDIAAAGMTMTQERAKNVLFAAPFYESKLVILAPNGSGITSIDDLQGKTVAVQMGTTGAGYAEQKGLNIKQFDHNSELIMDLQVGGAQAGILDKPVADYFLAQDGKGKYEIIDIPDTKSEYLAFAINKNNTELQKEVNAALAKLKETGEFQKLYKQWFNMDAPDLPATAEEALK